MTVNNNATGSSRQLLTSDSETIKAYDQYESQISISTVDNEVLSAPSAETNHKKGTTNFPVTYTTTGSMITVNASGLAEGSYQVKLTAHTTDGKCDTNATVSRVLTVNVVNVTDTPSTASYRLSVSDQKADLAIASDAVAADFANKAISTSVSEYQRVRR